MYSPLGWFSWKKWLWSLIGAKGDAPLIKTFVNTLAETFETDYVSAMSAEGLRRCESYEQGVCPMGFLFITQGVDCR